MNKLFYPILGIMLILIGVSAFLWISKPADMTEPNRQTDEKEKSINNDQPSQSSTIPTETNKTGPREQLGAFFSEEQLASPEMQRIFEILESSEGQAFLKSDSNGLADTFAFFESQGLKVNRNMFTEQYRSVFPTGEPEEFEQEMRQRLVEVAGSAELDPKNQEELDRFMDLVMKFRRDKRNSAWVSGKFQGNNKAFGKWVVQTLRNPVPSPVEQTPETVASESEFTFEMPPDAQDTVEFSTEEAELLPEPPTLEADIPTTETEMLEQVTEQPIEIDAEQLTPELPTEAQLEASLREQFKPERYQKAISTLNRYGPQEGLRRLKSDDPEIAKRIEPLLKRKENSQ